MRPLLLSLCLSVLFSAPAAAQTYHSVARLRSLDCVQDWTATCQPGLPAWLVGETHVELMGVLGEIESRYRIVARKQNTLELLELVRDLQGEWVDGRRHARMRLEGEAATYWGLCWRSIFSLNKACADHQPIELVAIGLYVQRRKELETALAPGGRCPNVRLGPASREGPCLNPPEDKKWRDVPLAEICLTPLAAREILGPRKSGTGDFSVRLDDGPWTPLPKDEPVPLPVSRKGRHRLQVRQGTTPLETLPLRFKPGAPGWLTLTRNGYGFFALETRTTECSPRK